jgi:methyltransferase-like protein/trans-aconitate methyltransferase
MTTPEAYDELPYVGVLGWDFQPSALATYATLFGLQPPPVLASRILDLGCGDGSNIIGIAQALPQAECVGIDFSPKHIAMGNNIISESGLHNVNLMCKDINTIDISELGLFDYIIVHGTYSWVDAKVQQRILQICKQNLTPNGIAYISYNVYPGWYLQQGVRDLMMFHTASYNDWHSKIAEGRAIVDFVLQAQIDKDSISTQLLQQLANIIHNQNDSYIGHEYLEQHNYPCYFQQFVANIQQHGLEYVTDVEFRRYLPTHYPSLEQFGQLVQDNIFAQEQYSDFIFNRNFRSSLLCHQSIVPNRELDWSLMQYFYVAASIPDLEPSYIYQNQDFILQTPKTSLTIDNQFVKAALLTLSNSYPQAIQFEQLFNVLCQNLTRESLASINLNELQATLAEELHYLYCLEAIELHTHPIQCVTKVSDYPIAPPLARWQAKGGGVIANMQCKIGELDSFTMNLLPYLDGSNNHEDLLQILLKLHADGVLILDCAPEAVKQIMQRNLQQVLQSLAKTALLVG